MFRFFGLYLSKMFSSWLAGRLVGVLAVPLLLSCYRCHHAVMRYAYRNRKMQFATVAAIRRRMRTTFFEKRKKKEEMSVIRHNKCKLITWASSLTQKRTGRKLKENNRNKWRTTHSHKHTYTDRERERVVWWQKRTQNNNINVRNEINLLSLQSFHISLFLFAFIFLMGVRLSILCA